MKSKLVVILLLIAQLSYGQNMFTKGIAKLAKKMGGASTTSASSLNDVVPTVGMGSNIHSDKLGTMSQTFFNGWKTGGDQIFIMFSKKNEASFAKIDGTVSVDGKPIEYLTSGMYGIVTDPNAGPRKVEIVTTSGEKSSFVIEPSKRTVKLTSINGQQGDNITLDLTKDVVLELSYPAEMEKQLMKVSIAINQLSIKSIYDVCYTRIGSKVIIPASAFRNINILPGGKAVYNYKNSYLSIGTESIENAKEVTGAFQAVQYTSVYTDGKFVNISAEPELNRGLTVSGKDKEMEYSFYKPSAFLSRPFNQIKKIGLTSFSIRGTTYDESTETKVTETQTQVITKTTTTKLTFPQQSNEVWDALMEKFYPDFVAVVESEFGASVLPVEKVTGTNTYKTVQAFAKDDNNTTVNFSRAFRDTKVISAFIPVAEGFGSNGLNERLMSEAGADALMNLTLDLQISQEEGGKLVLMVPKFAFEITGKINGLQTNTKYCTGTIQSTAGVSFKNDITMDELEKIIRKSDLLSVFRKGLQELKAKETSNGDYTTVWNLQN